MGINIGIDGNGHFIGGGEIVQNDNLILHLDPYDYGSMGANGGSHIRDLSAYENDMVLIGTACLLYTSPSPRDLSTSRMPSSA